MKRKGQKALITTVAVGDGNVTLAIVRMGDIRVIGSSKRDPRDKNNPGIGVDLAVARALGVLSRTLERRAQGDIRNAEWVQNNRRTGPPLTAGQIAERIKKSRRLKEVNNHVSETLEA